MFSVIYVKQFSPVAVMCNFLHPWGSITGTRSLKSDGFRKVRFESYPGAHEGFPEHTTAALQWSLSQTAGSGATPTRLLPSTSFSRNHKLLGDRRACARRSGNLFSLHE
ncbi:MAG: hypothetical protein M3480_02480 [Verrucomicrobiota bacterium]|nr:hypothetical protein [Chthoniobacterales bacterium]MDQ3413836.1 hypothetical protein [Verrucomicrobiota bacterium]